MATSKAKSTFCVIAVVIWLQQHYKSTLQAFTVRSSEALSHSKHSALSNQYLENDLVAISVPSRLVAPTSGEIEGAAEGETVDRPAPPERNCRFCVVLSDGIVAPLCRHEDDVETDLYVDPRTAGDNFWHEISDADVEKTYGEGWYGQRPVPSLGGGLGYGATSDEIWSIDQKLLIQLRDEGVSLPILDVGMAHGEKARGGSFS